MDIKNCSSQRNKIFIVAGGTGRSSRYIIKSLIQKNLTIYALVKDLNKLNQVFTEEERNKIHKIIQCDLFTDIDYREKLRKCFEQDKTAESVDIYVISGIGFSIDDYKLKRKGNVESNKRLIDAAKQYGGNNIKKFQLISSSHVTRPYSFFSLRSNIRNDYVLWDKVLTEDYLRKSGLTYLIIRPSKLKENEESCAFTITQGDNACGYINTATVGRLAVDTIIDAWIRDNTSLEVTTTEEQFKETYHYVQGYYHHLKPETEKEKNLVDHVIPTRIMKLIFASSLIILSYFTYVIGKKHFPWEKILSFFRRLIGRGRIKA